ncbi:MAG: serine/threonine protein kinase [Ktedonobacteraceae bacterium]
MSDLEGVILSDYLLLKCISKGGVADVYRARENGEGNFEVAVKVFRPGYAQREAFRDYFMAEAEKIGQFDHPNILPFLEFGEGEGLLYTVTPFVVPGTLEDLLVRVGGKFSAMQTLPIMQQLCSAVQYAHSHDVIHGNIKPTNVFVAADGRMLLSDFGIACGYDDSQQSLTRVGWGSAEYAAPEQSLGVVKRSSDIYALGVLLFRMLTGQPPFTGQTPVEVLLKHVRQPSPSSRALVPSISDAVDGVLKIALQKRSEDRFASAEEFGSAFLAAVSVAPVASPVARSIATSAPLSNPQTPVPALHTAGSVYDPQTPPPSANTTSPSSHTEFSFLATPFNDTSKQAPTTMNFGSPGLHSSEGKSIPKMSFLQENTSMGQDKYRFWSVDPDPLEWSPITNTQVGSVPLTANAYLHSKPLPPTELPPEPQTSSSLPQANDSQNENKLNEGLRKALPIVVVILLLLGLLGALLSSFYFPGDGHGAYSPPIPEHTAQFVVHSIKTLPVVPLSLLSTTPEYVEIED